jgi:hypothetical protein
MQPSQQQQQQSIYANNDVNEMYAEGNSGDLSHPSMQQYSSHYSQGFDKGNDSYQMGM